MIIRMIQKVQQYYEKYKKSIENICYPLVLFFYPLINVFEGVDVTDTTYSLGNFLYFDRMEGMWVISTYLSNVAGSLLVRLPGGNTLAGMNVYTGLILCALVLMCYFCLRRIMNASIVFAGEMIAVGFCWIPTDILYNYLTYFLFAAGALLLYEGIIKNRRILLFAAGICLGLNVMVRIPNITETALILGLWYYSWQKKETWQQVLQKTGICIGGYLLGFAVPFGAVLGQYGFGAFLDMINSLSAIKEVDASYSSFSMILSVVSAYLSSTKWAAVILVGILFGVMLFSFQKGRFLLGKKILYFAGIALTLRFFWGRGMFSFRYYEDYSSMFEWGMMGLFLSLTACILVLIKKSYKMEEKLFALLVLVILLITPLGSNNYTCQNLNNLFLAAPFTLFIYIRELTGRKRETAWPIRTYIAVIGLVILVQTIGFHTNFVFRDGMRGEKRDTRITGTQTTDGMYTNEENAAAVTGLAQFCREQALTGKEALFYGDIPGFSFLLRMPFAISTSWPDLESYSLKTMDQEMQQMEEPVIILSDTEPVSEMMAQKRDLVLDYISARHYENVYQNQRYSVYVVME